MTTRMGRIGTSDTTSDTENTTDAQASAASFEPVAVHLKRLGLTTLATAAPGLLETARQQRWPYETFLQQALGAELQGRAQRAYERRLRSAHLPASAVSVSLDSFDFGFQPTLSERLIRELATLGFLETATNLVFLGPPGVGKTHLALALLARTLDAGHSARFTTLRQLADELETTSWRQQRRRYLTPRLLVIDEVGYLRLTTSQAHQLFDLVTARYEHAPTILTSNRSFAEWGALLGDEVLATALLDRLLHHAEVIAIAGRSYRMKDRQLQTTPAFSEVVPEARNGTEES
jgi:DNA replication protein DnaC